MTTLPRFAAALLFPISLASLAAQPASQAPRERLSINNDWRFQKDDPPGNKVSLLYDVRPEVRDQRDDGPADSQPKDAEKAAVVAQALLKPWILPTGNAFIKNPAERHNPPKASWAGDVAYLKGDFNDSTWRRVNLPHDWAIEGPFIATGNGGGMGRLPSPGIGWYRKRLDIPAGDAGKCVFLDVDGAMSYATVWLNGQLVGGWPYGYASWRVNLTPYVHFGGENQLAIRLDNPADSSRWYPGGGIYRNVWLVKTQPIHLGHWGTFVTTPQASSSSATIVLETTIDNDSRQNANVSVATQIFELDASGHRTGEAVAGIAPAEVSIAANAGTTLTGSVVLATPKLWGPPPTQKPNRYVAVTTVTQEGRVVDRYETSFGIRSLRFDPNSGIYVNGERIQIKGVNQHHDLGSLGTAFNYRAAERQLEILREAGCNAIRMSHNPPAPELLELTDRMGFLVMDEAFDVWLRRKTPYDFHLIFTDWHEQDLRAMLRRDRNSPSIIIWSVGNEVGEQYTAEEGAALAKALCNIVHEEDPGRPATSATNYSRPDMPFPAALDVISLNYQGQGIRDTPEFEGTERIHMPPQFPVYHEKFPGKIILSSETASAFSSRGIYLFPVTKETSAPVRDGRGGDSKNRQVSSYELHAVDFGASADKVFASLERNPFVAGEFVWTGWDHLGEPTPYYSSRSAYCGIIDLAGFRKDRFYLYQSHWRPDFPMAHILPHWTWPDRVGQVTPVHVFTSGDEAELFLNGKSLGRKMKGAFEYRLRWDDVIYEPGTLEVVAFKHGAKWATEVVRTAKEASALETTPDRATIKADGLDLSFVTVRIVDENGRLAPHANHDLKFTVDGPGEFVAADNGDPTSFQPFHVAERKAFNGLCLVIVRGKSGQPGRIQITASGQGLRTGTATVVAEAGTL